MSKNIMVAAVLSACVLFTHCTTDLDIRRLEDETRFTAPVYHGPTEIVIGPEDISAEKNIQLSWSAADFGQPTEIIYGINVKYGSSQTEFFGNINETKYDVSAAEMQQKLKDSGIISGSKDMIYISVSATIGSDFEKIVSSPVPVSVLLEE